MNDTLRRFVILTLTTGVIAAGCISCPQYLQNLIKNFLPIDLFFKKEPLIKQNEVINEIKETNLMHEKMYAQFKVENNALFEKVNSFVGKDICSWQDSINT